MSPLTTSAINHNVAKFHLTSRAKQRTGIKQNTTKFTGMTDTVLVIYNEKEILESLSSALQEKYLVLPVYDAHTGINRLDEEPVSLIVSDSMLPEIDGFELCRKIKSTVKYCHIPIILLTAKNTSDAKLESLEVGADAYVEKPFSHEYLAAQIDNLLKNRARIKEHFAQSAFADMRVVAHSRTDELFLRRLDDYIQGNLGNTELDIKMLSEYMNMSRPTFYRKIKSLSSLTPKDLIHQARMRKAAELLASGDYKVYEISKMVGYTSQNAFVQNFQKHFNKNPAEYQALIRQEKIKQEGPATV